MNRMEALSRLGRKAAVVTALSLWSAAGAAQLLPTLLPTATAPTPSGQASAITAVVLGTITSLADTGTLTDASDSRDAGQTVGSIPNLLGAEVLHAVTLGWSDQVVSLASLANVALTVAGINITAEFVMSRASAASGAGGAGVVTIEGLTIAGVPLTPSGIPNEAFSVPGLTVILNEQAQSAGGIVVNALRVKTLDGTTDVAIGSAKARI